jgi:NADP-dependent 3-hydroxy acid dehydrogenase YdfG
MQLPTVDVIGTAPLSAPQSPDESAPSPITIYPGRTATSMQTRIHAHEKKPNHPAQLMQPEDVAAMVLSALVLPRTAEVTDLRMRPMQRPS